MSTVLDTNQIDATGFSKDGKTEMLLLLDHLDWTEEYEHLKLLQEKINGYLWFVESGQAKKLRPKKLVPTPIKLYVIDIRFQHPPTENCLKFLEAARRKASALKTDIQFKVAGSAPK